MGIEQARLDVHEDAIRVGCVQGEKRTTLRTTLLANPLFVISRWCIMSALLLRSLLAKLLA